LFGSSGGGGSIAEWLCRQVGGSGHVVATDLEPRFLEAINLSNLEVWRHLAEVWNSADGTVSGGGKFAEDTSHTVTATPNTGHTFVHWTESGRVVSTSESYTFTLDGNVTLVADFR
jgi:hypothetical protein